MTDPVETFFARYTLDVQNISRALRDMVLNQMPGVVEVLYDSQNHTGYSITGKTNDMIVYITPMKDYVRLGLMRGTELPDPENVLVGEGKWLRHVKVRTLDDAANSAYSALVSAAWADAHKK
jgi:hypothetical protein